jgi:hypothetical protein
MNLQDPAEHMRSKLFGDKKPADKKPVISKPEGDEPDGDESEPKEALHIIIAKKPEGGYHSKMDAKDGFPPDEADHDTLADAHQAHKEALEAKFGESADKEDDGSEGEGEDTSVEKPAKKSAGKPGGFREMFGGGE